MGSQDRYDITRHANGPAARQVRSHEQDAPNASSGINMGAEGDRPSRDNIIKNYNAKDAIRARNARLYSQEAMQEFQEREERTRERRRQRDEYATQAQQAGLVEKMPAQSHMSLEQAKARAREIRSQNRQRSTMTTQESHDRTLVSKEHFEIERARRDVFSRNSSRSSNREVIDGRGSIDSRAFNERNELIGYSIDQTDRPEPIVETPADDRAKWRSHAGQGFTAPVATAGNGFSRRQGSLDRLSDTISGKSQYQSAGPLSSIPLSAKILIVIIVILLGILIFLLFS